MTAADPRLVLDAVLAGLNTALPWPTGDTTRPGAAEFPYLVAYPITAGATIAAGWADTGPLEWVAVQITAAGTTRAQAQLLARNAALWVMGRDADRTYTNPIAGTGWEIIERRQTLRDDLADGGIHNSTRRYELLVAVDA